MMHKINSLFKSQRTTKYFRQILYNPDQRKYAIQWLKSLNPEYMLNKGVPWITFGAIDFLQANLPLNINVFEYGSGSSTIFWQKFNARCVSIEHDPEWHRKISCYLQMFSYEVDHRLVLPELRNSDNLVTEHEAGIPDLYLSADEKFHTCNFQSYVSQIDHFSDSYFDAVLVDGRARPSCLVHSASKVKVGGYLILDNANREYYFENTRNTLKNFKAVSFCGVTPALSWSSRTDVFIRQS